MKKKQRFITFLVVLVIFLTGFLIRLDYIRLPGVPENDKVFYEDPNGLPYLYEFGDSYYHYRLTKNFLDHGYLGDTKINGREWDIHSYYPPGVPMDYPPLIVYIAAFVYKFINLFAGVSLITVCFWIPAFLGPIAGIIAYFFTARFTNKYGAAAAGMLTATSPLYAVRTVPGFFDTDMFIVIFPLIIIWLFIEALQSKNRKMQYIFAGLSGFSLFVFSIAWSGWYYLFYIIFISAIFYLIWLKIKRKNIKYAGTVLFTFLAASIFFIIVLTGFSNISRLVNEPVLLIKELGKSPWAPWPNVYTLVSELSRPSIREVIADIGLAFPLAIIGIIWLFRVLKDRRLKELVLKKITWFIYSFFLFWIVVGLFLIFVGGDRFTLLLIPPVVIIAGIMTGILIEYLTLIKDTRKFEFLNRKKNLIKFISIIILTFIIIPPIFGTYNIISDIHPSANDDLWDAAEWIGSNTSKETIVISNWSKGHLFAAISDRPVTFDGRLGYIENLSSRKNDNAFKYGTRSPGTSREYWIDKALCTGNEALSFGILKMLAASGDSAYLAIEDFTGSTAESVEILNNILGLEKESARNILLNNYHFSSSQSNAVLDLTHPVKVTPFIFVSTDELRDNAYFIFKFGEWDFINDKGPDYTYSIASYDMNNNALISKNGILEEAGDFKWNGKPPYCVELISGSKIEKSYIDKTSNFCLIILEEYKKAVVIDKKFENSLFTKLFLEKIENNYFSLIYKNQTVAIWE